MAKEFKSKKSIKEQQYDSYWKLTVEYTDIYDIKFNNTLKVIINFIDRYDLNHKKCTKELNKELQNRLFTMFPKADKASVRKSINQFIKLGFVNSGYRGYHTLAKRFLNTQDKKLKKNIFSQIFYDNSSFSASYTKKSDVSEIKFLLKTLLYHPNKKLTKKDIIALMVTPYINEIKKGYLTADELEEQYRFSELISFQEKKYNQIAYMFTFLNLMPDLYADKEKGIFFNDESNENLYIPDTNRDPFLHGLYRDSLKNESISIYGNSVCYLDKKHYKGLVASHIKPLKTCLEEKKAMEAYDYNNGLLLQPQVDVYFDKFDISFNNDGKILINLDSDITSEYAEQLQNYSLDIEILNDTRKKYLKFHREKFEKKLNNK